MRKKNQISIVRVQLWYTHILKYNAAIKSRELAGTIQRGLAWPLYKNDMQIYEVFHKKKNVTDRQHTYLSIFCAYVSIFTNSSKI